mgnify:FL=1
MSASSFVDTNVLVYSRDANAGEKQVRARAWLERLWKARNGRLCYQVLNEYYVITTRKLHPSLPRGLARRDVRALLAWRPAGVSEEVLSEAWDIQDRFGFSWWDSLIVASARILGASYLLTEALQAGQDLDGLLVVNPFETEPTTLGA